MKAKFLILIALLFLVIAVDAQDRVKPGILYTSQEPIYGPVAGVKAIIPKDWVGILPKDTEAFLMAPATNTDAEIIVMVDKDNIEEIKKRWLQGMQFSEDIFISVDGEIKERKGWMTADIKVTGGSGNAAGYAEARCGMYGNCVANLLISTPDDIKKYKSVLKEFDDNLTFVQPKEVGIYDDFDWAKKLVNKDLIKWTTDGKYKQNNRLRLCGNGSFNMKIKSKGIIKGDKSPYYGKNSGEWEVDGVGQTAKLYLYFKNITDLVLDLKLEDDKLYINDIRYFFMQSESCR